jgi:hypothetical protein
MSEFAVQSLLETSTVMVRDVYCQGSSRGQSAEECATDTQLVFPYRGVYVRRLGREVATMVGGLPLEVELPSQS